MPLLCSNAVSDLAHGFRIFSEVASCPARIDTMRDGGGMMGGSRALPLAVCVNVDPLAISETVRALGPNVAPSTSPSL
ncbi:MAG: hypothetical protein WBW25_00455 [Halobacteriota archaeon]